MTAADIAAIIEKPYRTRFWGSECDVEPVFIRKKFGNGKRLVSITALNSRPQYYVVRIGTGTRWDLDGKDWLDRVDEIIEAIQDQCGDESDSDEHEPMLGWPAWDDSSGFGWSEYLLRKDLA